MNYMQKIATAAVSGAVASGAAMALNRRVVEPFREYLHRREQRTEQLAELKEWYEEELTRAYDFAARFTDQFFEMRQQNPHAAQDFLGNDTSQVELSDFKINWYVWKYKELAVVKERAARLIDISPRRADDERVKAARLRANLVEEERTLRRENYPMNAVHDMIATFK